MRKLKTGAVENLSFGQLLPVAMGADRRLSGSYELINNTDQDVFVRTVPVSAQDLCDRRGEQIREMPVMRNIPAGSMVSLPMRLRLHRQTPPGQYTVAAMLGDECREFEVQVQERRQIRLDPFQIILEGEPKAKLTQPVGLTNLGNVPFAVGKLGAVILEESGGVCRGVQASLRATGSEGYEPFLNALVAELASTRVDMLRVRLLEGPTEIAPGETRAIPLEFHLPGDLKPGRRYFGQLELGTGAINLQVTALGQPPDYPQIPQ